MTNRIRKFTKRQYVLIAIISLAIVLFIFSYNTEKIVLCKYPGCARNAVVFTVDDISLANDNQLNITSRLVSFFESNNLSATFFAIPTEMKEYDFPENIEIAQHGYSHRNRVGLAYEFLGISDEEAEQRIIIGKELLESKGYMIYGFRAPTYYFRQKNMDILKQNFGYDSSFFINRAQGFEYPVIFHDLTFFPKIGFIQQEWVIILSDIIQRPIIYSMHFYPADELLSTDEGRGYLDQIVKRTSHEEYFITTMKNLSDWTKESSKTTYLFDEDTNQLEIINPVDGQTFMIRSDEKILSKISLSCQKKDDTQFCTINNS